MASAPRVSPKKQVENRDSVAATIASVPAKVDSVAMARMPSDFQRMFKKKPKPAERK